ncbi:hypothetical protein A2U01_0086236, partial [Trifolium medium]|nr:hypothetical protein [Trifolium medium]
MHQSLGAPRSNQSLFSLAVKQNMLQDHWLLVKPIGCSHYS